MKLPGRDEAARAKWSCPGQMKLPGSNELCAAIFELPGPNELARANWSCPGIFPAHVTVDHSAPTAVSPAVVNARFARVRFQRILLVGHSAPTAVPSRAPHPAAPRNWPVHDFGWRRSASSIFFFSHTNSCPKKLFAGTPHQAGGPPPTTIATGHMGREKQRTRARI
jgi:hypothetical protein